MNTKIIAYVGPLKGTSFELGDETVSIGRDAENAIRLDDLSASRQHCLLLREGDGYRLVDLDSHNGTFLNDIPIRNSALRHGDRVKVGNSIFLFACHDGETVEAEYGVELIDEALATTTLIRLRAEDSPPMITRELDALVKISIAINSIRGLEELERELLKLILDVVPAERGAIMLLKEGTDEFDSVFGLWRDPLAGGPVVASRTVVQQVLREATALMSNDVQDDSGFGSIESIISSKVSSFIYAPVVLASVTVGVVYLDTRDRSCRFKERHMQLVLAVANIAAGVLNNAKRVQELEREIERLRSELEAGQSLVGGGPRMRQVYEFITRVASVNSTVLISGESGTGKELVAHAIHRNSPRAAKPFVVVNCAALAENLLESELFGHEKGAFTGAIAQKKGKLEMADGGTLFLDEIGELPIALQAKLLRALQEREFERVGGTRTHRVDIRVIGATNRDLEHSVKQGAFRRDLYYRLNVVSVVLPPLRERREDIPLLSNYFAARYGERCNRRVTSISSEARACLVRYDWPGNVRELENAIERAVVLGSATTILPEDLPETIIEAGAVPQNTPPPSYYKQVREAKKQLILNALDSAGGNFAEAAILLDVHPNNLHRLIRNLGLRPLLKK